ncbi:leucyl aminopeptidase [Candidatus Micrarchaeota archaeon]|nr:leucyl aminopeptidase [Candidatus Micrarchaeota archaeon]
MEIKLKSLRLNEIKEGVVAGAVFEKEEIPQEFKKFGDRLKRKKFTGADGECEDFQEEGRTLLLFGLGKKEEFNQDKVRKISAQAYSYTEGNKEKKLYLIAPEKGVRPAVEGAVLASYKFEKFKTKKKEEKEKEVKVEEITVIAAEDEKNSEELRIGKIYADAQNYVREINETPPNIMNPEKLAETAEKLSKENKLDVKIFDEKEMEKKKMNAILAVGKGSENKPRMIVLEYNKNKKDLPLYAVVGKGITFDSGGIDLKPSRGMGEMKYDKSGAVDVLGIMKAVSELKLPIRVVGIIVAAENMPDGKAQRPSDIVRAYNGKTIEVLNTDAEGRMVLADAIAYASEMKPKAIIDLATLTGAIVVCLGKHGIGLFSNDDVLSETIEKAGKTTYERVWKFPMWDEYKEMVKGIYGDVKNIGSDRGEAGSITAACFLQEFVGEKIKWAHLDIAGVESFESHSYLGKGASGMGVRLVTEALRNMKI